MPGRPGARRMHASYSNHRQHLRRRIYGNDNFRARTRQHWIDGAWVDRALLYSEETCLACRRIPAGTTGNTEKQEEIPAFLCSRTRFHDRNPVAGNIVVRESNRRLRRIAAEFRAIVKPPPFSGVIARHQGASRTQTFVQIQRRDTSAYSD